MSMKSYTVITNLTDSAQIPLHMSKHYALWTVVDVYVTLTLCVD